MNKQTRDNHGVQGRSDPDFKPDPNYVHVYDEKKGVYRLVKAKDAKKLLER